jgi:hypothetical protein
MHHVIRTHLCLLLALLAAPAPGVPAPATGEAEAAKATGTLRIERAVLSPGGASESASFRVIGSAGQADAGVSSGPTWRIEGGFWVVKGDDPPPLGEAVFSDGFEGG